MSSDAVLARATKLIRQGMKPIDALVQARTEAMAEKQQKEPA